MADAFGKLAQLFIPSSAGVLYTAPVGSMAVVTFVRIVNVTSGGVNFNLYQGGSALVNMVVGPNEVVQPGDIWTDSGPYMLGALDTLQGIASVANALALTLSGDLIT